MKWLLLRCLSYQMIWFHGSTNSKKPDMEQKSCIILYVASPILVEPRTKADTVFTGVS